MTWPEVGSAFAYRRTLFPADPCPVQGVCHEAPYGRTQQAGLKRPRFSWTPI